MSSRSQPDRRLFIHSFKALIFYFYMVTGSDVKHVTRHDIILILCTREMHMYEHDYGNMYFLFVLQINTVNEIRDGEQGPPDGHCGIVHMILRRLRLGRHLLLRRSKGRVAGYVLFTSFRFQVGHFQRYICGRMVEQGDWPLFNLFGFQKFKQYVGWKETESLAARSVHNNMGTGVEHKLCPKARET